MPSWTAPITAGTDLNDAAAVWNMLIAAFNERQLVAATISGITNAGALALLPTLAGGAISAGTDVQFVQQYASNTPDYGLLRGLQSIQFQYFVDYSNAGALAGAVPGSIPAMTIDRARSLAGLPPVLRYQVLGGAGATAMTGPTGSWRRQAPRQIYSTSSLYDVDGNPAIAGQCAEHLYGSGQPFRWYRFDGTSWVLDNTATPDLLDNTFAPPNNLSWFNNSPTGRIDMGGDGYFGFHNIGDYITCIQLEELRLVLDQLRWTFAVPVGTGQAGPQSVSQQVNGYPTVAAAVAAAQADYATRAAAQAARRWRSHR